MADFRALCAEGVAFIRSATDPDDLSINAEEWADKAHAALAESEPEGLTVQEISNLPQIFDSLASSQVELDAESKEVLHANLWDLYIIPNKPEGPTDNELEEEFGRALLKLPGDSMNATAVAFARAVLARWGK